VGIEVEPATPDRWDDVVAAFGRRGNDPSWCWCRRFLRDPDAPDADAGLTNRDALQAEIADAAVPPGLVAYLDGRPVGWTRVGPRRDFPLLWANRALAKVLEPDDGTWWVTCFAVDSRHRGLGVGSALLHAAVDFAGRHGASAVEGHPADVGDASAARASGAAILTGTVAMFSAAGFTEVARTYPTRPVMRIEL